MRYLIIRGQTFNETEANSQAKQVLDFCDDTAHRGQPVVVPFQPHPCLTMVASVFFFF
jgi:hypothetical protein